MDDMDIDQVAEVPDTPDRITAQRSNSPLWEADSSSSPHPMNRKSLNWPRRSGQVASSIGQNKRPYMRPPKKIGTIEFGCQSHSISGSASENSGNSSLDLIGSSSHDRVLEFPNSFGASPGFREDDSRRVGITNGGQCLCPSSDSFQTLSRSYKGKEKEGERKFEDADSVVLCEKRADLPMAAFDKSSKHLSLSAKDACFPRHVGQKRLVRNGCISPHNIATRAKELDERMSHNPKKLGPTQMSSKGSSGVAIPSSPEFQEVIAEENTRKGLKGKGILIHPCTSEKQEANLADISTNGFTNLCEHKGTNNVAVDVVERNGGAGGWRTTRVPHKRAHCLRSGAEVHISGGSNHPGIFACNPDNAVQEKNSSYANQRGRRVNFANKNAYQRNSGPVTEVDRRAVLQSPTNISAGRQQKRGLPFKNDNAHSGLVSHSSEVILLGSPGDSRSPLSVRRQMDRGTSSSVIEIDDTPPGQCQLGTSHELDARGRQMEADEMLARELQEQLYNESPVVGSWEMDEYIAMLLQQEEDEGHASSNSSASHQLTGSGDAFLTQSRRQPLRHSFRNLLNSRGAQARVPVRERLRQARRPHTRSSSAFSSGERSLHFPLNMDIDTRMDILEAMESTFGDVNEMGISSSIFQTQRDFNENDYEMLLALDECNNPVGASHNLINSLPESKVQTSVVEEACAICLETPVLGDMIRHLPCFHKFHKNCIDPWLRRSTSCPVCKLSVT